MNVAGTVITIRDELYPSQNEDCAMRLIVRQRQGAQSVSYDARLFLGKGPHVPHIVSYCVASAEGRTEREATIRVQERWRQNRDNISRFIVLFDVSLDPM